VIGLNLEVPIPFHRFCLAFIFSKYFFLFGSYFKELFNGRETGRKTLSNSVRYF
jgi:hypothetical protein